MYYLTGFLGIVLVIAPFILGYSDSPTALWTSIGIGATLTVASVLEWTAEGTQMWEYWVLGIAGLAAVIAPFILGFGFMTISAWTMLLTGFIAMGVAGSKLVPGAKRY